MAVMVGLCCPLAGPATAQPQVSFGAPAVTVSGLTPAGRVAWWAVSHEPQEYELRVVRRGGLEADTDGDGAVTLPGLTTPALRTVVAVVDLDSGEHLAAAPEAFSPGILELEPDEGLGEPGQPGRLAAHREALEILFARPGTGAWSLSARDGAGTDGDGAEDGSLEADLSSAAPLGASSAPPGELQAGDVVFAIDPRSLEVFVLRLAGEGPAEEAP